MAVRVLPDFTPLARQCPWATWVPYTEWYLLETCRPAAPGARRAAPGGRLGGGGRRERLCRARAGLAGRRAGGEGTLVAGRCRARAGRARAAPARPAAARPDRRDRAVRAARAGAHPLPLVLFKTSVLLVTLSWALSGKSGRLQPSFNPRLCTPHVFKAKVWNAPRNLQGMEHILTLQGCWVAPACRQRRCLAGSCCAGGGRGRWRRYPGSARGVAAARHRAGAPAGLRGGAEGAGGAARARGRGGGRAGRLAQHAPDGDGRGRAHAAVGVFSLFEVLVSPWL